MPIYETNCNLCSQKTLHSAADDAGAGEMHRSLDSHKEAQAQLDAISEKYNKLRAADAENFKHGKDHND